MSKSVSLKTEMAMGVMTKKERLAAQKVAAKEAKKKSKSEDAE